MQRPIPLEVATLISSLFQCAFLSVPPLGTICLPHCNGLHLKISRPRHLLSTVFSIIHVTTSRLSCFQPSGLFLLPFWWLCIANLPCWPLLGFPDILYQYIRDLTNRGNTNQFCGIRTISGTSREGGGGEAVESSKSIAHGWTSASSQQARLISLCQIRPEEQDTTRIFLPEI